MQPTVLYPWRMIAKLWSRATRPGKDVPEAEQRSAGLLAAILVVLFILGVYHFAMNGVLKEGHFSEAGLYPLIGGFAAVLVGWMLSRTSYYRWVVPVLVVVFDLVIFLAALPFDHPAHIELQVYLVVPVVLSSLWLTWQATTALAVANGLGMLLVLLVFDDVALQDMWVGYVTGMSALVILITRNLTLIDETHQDELSEARLRYQRLVEHAPVAIAVLQDGKLVYVNPAAVRLLGGQIPEDVLGLTVDDIIVPAQRASSEQRIKDVQEGRSVQPVHRQIVRLDGATVDTEVVIIPFTYEDRPAMQVVAQDITARLESESVLRRNEVRQRALLNAIPDLLFRFNREGVVLDVQAEGKEDVLIGDPRTIIGRHVEDDLQPEYGQRLRAAISQTLDTGVMQVLEYGIDFNGQHREFEGRVVLSGPDEVLYIVREITERKKAENALRMSERQNRAILAAMPDLILQFDRSGTILDVHAEGSEDLLVAPPPDLLGKSIGMFLLAQSIPDTLLRIEKALAGEMQVWEYPLKVPAGLRFFESRMVASGDSRVLAVIRDITERHNSEEALRRRDGMLEMLANMSGRLLKSDDLETALHGAISYLGQVMDMSYALLFTNQNSPQEGDIAATLTMGWTVFDRPLDAEFYRDQKLHVSPSTWLSQMAAGQAAWGSPGDFGEPIRSQLESVDAKSAVLVPIFVEDVWWGTLSLIDSERERHWLPVEIEVLRSAANVLGSAILRQRFQAAEREQRVLAETLRDTLAAINRTLDPDSVLDLILANIERVVPHDAANIMLLSEGRVRFARGRGYEAYGTAEMMQSLDAPIEKWRPILDVVQTGHPTIISDTRTLSYWDTSKEFQWMRSMMATPIRSEDRLIGLIVLDSAQPNAFTARHGEVLLTFAEQAAVAITNARLYDELLRNMEELAVLYRGTSFLFSTLPAVTSMTELGGQIVRTVVKTFKQVDCGLLLLNPQTGKLDTLARAGDFQIRHAHQLQIDGAGLVPSAVRSGELIYAPDVSADDRYVMGDPRTASELAIPIKTSGGETIGALDLQSTEIDAFTAQDKNVLMAFAERIAAVIENRQLYAEIQRHADQMEQRVKERTTDLSVRNAVAETLSGSLDTTAMLAGVLHTLIDRLGLTGGAVFLPNVQTQAMELAVKQGVTDEMVAALLDFAPDRWKPRISQTGSLIAPQPQVRQTSPEGLAVTLDVPIWRQRQIRGVITLVHDQPRAWSVDELRLVDAIGQQIGVALANAQLYAEAVSGEARLRTIVQSAADGILVFDPAQKLVLINPAGEALFQFYPAEQGGAETAASRLWSWLQARTANLGAFQAVEFSLPVDALVNSRQSTGCEQEACAYGLRQDRYWPCWLISGEGPEDEIEQCPVYQHIVRRVLQAHSATVRDPNGEITGTVIVLHDVTYYRELDNLKGRFVSTVSHELRTPLSAILLDISSLAKYYDRFGENERRHIVNQVYGQANVLKELIEDILELSRFDARRAAPHKQWFDLAAHSRELIETMRSVTRDHDLVIDLTQLAGVQYVHGDPGQLMRVLRNLFSNALKYTPNGGVVSVGLEREQDRIQLWVKDTGIGIVPEEQVYVFDPFFRTEEAAQVASGTGLGLAITREIVELHNGRIDLTSVPGEGSLFTVTLPVPTGTDLVLEL